MTDLAKVMSRPFARSLYKAETERRAERGRRNPYVVGARGHARRLLRGQRRRMGA